MRDSTGHDVPVKYISKYDRERDKRVRAILTRWRKGRDLLESIVADCLADIEAIQAARESDPNARGNFQCQSFDGLVQVSLDQAWHIRLDDRVVTARDIMLDYAKALCDKAGRDAQALFEIVQEAFMVGRSGGLSVSRVLSLCRRNIQSPEWLRARKMLLESVETDKGKAYIRVAVRPSVQRDFAAIRLDIADCWPLPDADEVDA